MVNQHQICYIDEDLCSGCGFCQAVSYCPSPEICIGCGVCVEACPSQARSLVPDEHPHEQITLHVDNQGVSVSERTTVLCALENVGYTFGLTYGEADLVAPCRTGGCWGCSVLVDDGISRACVHPIKDGMQVDTQIPVDQQPLRIIHGPQPHAVGGKATPWHLKGVERYIEVAIWTAGCNLRCPQCQNASTTYDGQSSPVTPEQAAHRVTDARKRYRVDRMAISGGEPTLNRPWLIAYFNCLRELNPDPSARLHLDSNGTVLTPDYIDELVIAGVTDIGIEPKGLEPETFMRISGISDQDLAIRFLSTAWDAIMHIAKHYSEKIFLGVGLPYNRSLITPKEVLNFGKRLASIDSGIQLCVLDYFPTFRRQQLKRPSLKEMLNIQSLLESTGLKNVVVQTSLGHFGPGGQIL